MTSSKTTIGGKIYFWIVLSVFCTVVVVVSFFLNSEYREILPFSTSVHQYISTWTFRFAAIGALFFCLGMCFHNTAIKTVMFSLLAAFAALGAGEWYLTRRETEQAVSVIQMSSVTNTPATKAVDIASLPARYITMDELSQHKKNSQGLISGEIITYSESIISDSVLGYRPVRRAASIVAIKLKGEHVIFDATYTLLPTGWRIVPQNPEATEAVVFFGCSFTFGAGVNDNQTYPYKVAEQIGEHYQVFNFGFDGYGPHHMLAMIQNGFLDDIAKKYEKLHVFFLTMSGHELRSVGKPSWSKRGPWYDVIDEGGVILMGMLRDKEAREKSLEQPAFLRAFGENERMRNLYIEIIKRANRDLQEKYDTNLNVIAWPEKYNTDLNVTAWPKWWTSSIHKEGITVLDLIGISLDAKHKIKYDGHPNELSYIEVADRIVHFIIDAQR